MILTREARHLYRALDARRREYSIWREKALGAGDFDRALDYQRKLLRLDRVLDKALTREFRREDKGL